MPAAPPESCLHRNADALGLLSWIPADWLVGAVLPDAGADHEAGWCRECQRYVWRELGSDYWTALAPPAQA